MRGNNRPSMHTNILCNTRYSIVHKLSNKQNAKMICRFDKLSHNYEHWKLIGHPCIWFQSAHDWTWPHQLWRLCYGPDKWNLNAVRGNRYSQWSMDILYTHGLYHMQPLWYNPWMCIYSTKYTYGSYRIVLLYLLLKRNIVGN